MSLLKEWNGRAAVIDAPAGALEKAGSEFDTADGTKHAAAAAGSSPLILDLIPLHAPAATDAKGRPIGKAPMHAGWRRCSPMTPAEAAAHRAAGRNLGARLRGDQLVVDADPRNYAPGDDPLQRLRHDVGLPDVPPRDTGALAAHRDLR